jgi:hypothetical protein
MHEIGCGRQNKLLNNVSINYYRRLNTMAELLVQTTKYSERIEYSRQTT